MQKNRLAQETSPYLQQHAHNPIDWYPWSQEALDKAKRENKPILLSIGYAACHWCHVMAYESFEDEATAKLMNLLYVNIKIDREERPDLDKIFQTAHYLLTQRNGGWPLTLFLDPNDLTPFFSGTYFPREARYQLPAFKDVLRSISEIYKKNPEDINKQNQQLITILNQDLQPVAKVTLTDGPIGVAKQVLHQKFDTAQGGFGGAPKFPQPSKLEFLLQDKSPMVAATLLKMAQGGIYDQIQGGFFRYAVDEKWQIPHFEKMLYDNAQLLSLYALASQEFEEPYFATIAYETADWIMSKMQSPEGGYYSSLDADSEGHEGKYYIWNKFEISTTLTEKEAKFANIYFGLQESANFEKQWHLHVATSFDETVKKLNISSTEAGQLLISIKQKLSAIRENRIPPSYDQKILTAWNSLMIKGMCIAGDILQEPRYIESAERAINLIHEKLWVNNRLLVSYKDGKAHISAYLDDYAYLLDALLTYLQVSWNRKYLEFATQLADNLLDHFEDKKMGGFFFTANDQEKVLYRPKSMVDEVIPSGNGVAADALLTLGHLLGETRYLDAAEKTLQASWPTLNEFAAEHCRVLVTLQNYLTPPKLIIIRGEGNEMKKWRDFCKKQDYSHAVVFAIPKDEQALPGLLTSRKATDKTCAYICQGLQCLPTIDDFDKLKN